MTTTKQQTNENLRVLILPQADIQRLQALLAKEINTAEYTTLESKRNLFYAKEHNLDFSIKYWRNALSTNKRKEQNLANLQYKLKHQTLYPLNAAVMLSSVYGPKFYD